MPDILVAYDQERCFFRYARIDLAACNSCEVGGLLPRYRKCTGENRYLAVEWPFGVAFTRDAAASRRHDAPANTDHALIQGHTRFTNGTNENEAGGAGIFRRVMMAKTDAEVCGKVL